MRRGVKTTELQQSAVLLTSLLQAPLGHPRLRDSASTFDMLRRCIFVAGLAASAEAFQPVGAARVRGASFAPTPTWRRASPAVALELRVEQCKKRLAPRL